MFLCRLASTINCIHWHISMSREKSSRKRGKREKLKQEQEDTMRQKEKRFLLWNVELHSFLIQQQLRIAGKVGRGPGKGARRTTCVCVDAHVAQDSSERHEVGRKLYLRINLFALWTFRERALWYFRRIKQFRFLAGGSFLRLILIIEQVPTVSLGSFGFQW